MIFPVAVSTAVSNPVSIRPNRFWRWRRSRYTLLTIIMYFVNLLIKTLGLMNFCLGASTKVEFSQQMFRGKMQKLNQKPISYTFR